MWSGRALSLSPTNSSHGIALAFGVRTIGRVQNKSVEHDAPRRSVITCDKVVRFNVSACPARRYALSDTLSCAHFLGAFTIVVRTLENRSSVIL